MDAYFSDLIYQANLKNGADACVYVLFEHKSYPERLITFHLLRYMVRIWEQALKEGLAGSLPVIIPVVIYHGLARWRVDERFMSLFKCPEELRAYLPDFSFALCDISRFSDEEIRGVVLLKTTLLLMKYILREELREQLPKILGLLRELIKKRTGMEYLETVLNYVSRGTDRVDEEDVRRALEEAFPDRGGEIMPTLAEKWIQQGRQEGREEGRQEGLQEGRQEGVLEGLVEAIELGLELKFGAKGMKLMPVIRKIKDPDRLKAIKESIKVAVKVSEIEEITKGA